MRVFLFLFSFSTFICFSQEQKTSKLKPYKLGFLYNYGTEDNFIFDDKDYTYQTNTFKAQAFYKLGNWKKLDLELIVQPQVQFLQHQLFNTFYVTPDIPNFEEKTKEFIQPKNMSLYAVEFTVAAKRKLIKKLNIQGGISLGFAYIDKRTERLARGFTFIENFSLGFEYEVFTSSFIYLGSNLGHVSNLNFQKPNDGYNIMGIEFGYSFKI